MNEMKNISLEDLEKIIMNVPLTEQAEALKINLLSSGFIDIVCNDDGTCDATDSESSMRFRKIKMNLPTG